MTGARSVLSPIFQRMKLQRENERMEIMAAEKGRRSTYGRLGLLLLKLRMAEGRRSAKDGRGVVLAIGVAEQSRNGTETQTWGGT